MNALKMLVFIGVFLCSFAAMGDDFPMAESSGSNNMNVGSYHIDILLPTYMQWTLYKDNKDVSGYTKIYLPQKANNMSDQNITVNYSKDVQTSLKDSMQEVVNALDNTDCKVQDTKILTKLNKSIVFTVALDQCANNKSAIQVFKIFNTEDGQYSIIYSADLTVTDQDTVNKMKSTIEFARLVVN